MSGISRIIHIPYVWEALRKAGLLKGYQRRELARLTRAKAEIDGRLARKRERGEPVRVLFVCHRPQVWVSLKGVYEALKADARFEVGIVAIPQRSPVKLLGYLNRRYASEGAEDFFRAEGCVEGYNYDTRKWLDLRSLRPDYVFFQQPYNIARPPAYTSAAVSAFAKVCYVTYYVMLDLDERTVSCTPADFMRDLSFYFSQNEADAAFIRERLEAAGPNLCRVEVTGHPRLEGLEKHREDRCALWRREDSFKVLWTPRWTTAEGNCHFFSYREPLTAWCAADGNAELMLRPHPQAFREWRSAGELTEAREAELRREFSQGNFHLDESEDFYPQLFTADVLITDPSSLIIDAFFTGKPILYCASGGVNDGVTETLRPGLYRAETWEEAQDILNRLRAGEDPLKEVREECLRRYQGGAENHPADRIRRILLEDALGANRG